MKKIVAFLAIAAVSTAVWASCRTQTIYLPSGKVLICTVCCDSWGNCNTTCY